MTQVEALARYAARAKFDDLSAESRKQLPVHILDSLGCCIAALGAGPVQACREQVAEFGGRVSDFSGSQAMWDTFVNLGTGPRLLEYSLDMRSPGHNGKLSPAAK